MLVIVNPLSPLNWPETVAGPSEDKACMPDQSQAGQSHKNKSRIIQQHLLHPFPLLALGEYPLKKCQAEEM